MFCAQSGEDSETADSTADCRKGDSNEVEKCQLEHQTRRIPN